ncbi:MAG: hypothetical protein FWC26_05045 [Fibromonadales bacterium]|nr:hypothetical protein [Fibromonadales bacterium]
MISEKHGTIRAATLKKTIQIIMEHFNCDENEALKKFYESHIGACFADDSTGLYGQSSFYIASLFLNENT